jgi:hypothetical protein
MERDIHMKRKCQESSKSAKKKPTSSMPRFRIITDPDKLAELHAQADREREKRKIANIKLEMAGV